ncbi:MAG: HlyD family secretion protein [Chloracidobacterium sp.]|nr:HlyD family secretion protein [Chloracidobacterium sp.]MDW8218395.1 HlyD family efflux transporter periplasmic adaptor subunit [Acidobacteriota bacterium]
MAQTARQLKAVPLPSPATTPQALRLVESPRPAQPLALLLVLFLILVILALIYVPWQQSITGVGQVIIYSPNERPQNVQAQIPGRLKGWKVKEGDFVEAGTVIAEIAEIDAKFLDPNQLERLERQREFLTAQREAAQNRAAALQQQIAALEQSRNLAIPAAKERVRQAADRLRAAEQSLEAAKQTLLANELNFERIRDLNKGKKDADGNWIIQPGLRSDRDFELARQAVETSRAEVARLEALLNVAVQDLKVAELDAKRVENDTLASLSSAQSAYAAAQETIASLGNSLQKLDIDIQNFRVRVSQRQVVAPRAGQVTQLRAVGETETLKAGDVLCVLVPRVTEEEQAVELLISDFDAPLVRIGDPVRLQFEGFPAVQFVAWPSVAIGTFGGRVVAIDAVDDGMNRFRLLVKPDYEAIEKGKDDPWPRLDMLRPGTQATGWVMLRVVSLGFELWRQFNGFPPMFDRNPIERRKKPKDDKAKVKEKGDKDDDADKGDK